MPKTAYFLEGFDDALDLSGSLVISLDPAVSYRLEKNKIPYAILEDYYKEEDLRKGEGEYFLRQLEWFRALDFFLQKRISLCSENKIPIATANYTRLKYCIDTVLISVFVLRRIFEKLAGVGVREVVYVHRARADQRPLSVFDPVENARWISGQVIRIFAEAKGLSFSEAALAAGKAPMGAAASRACFAGVKRQLKVFISFLKWNKILLFFKKSQLRLFFTHLGSSDTDIPLKNFIGIGAKVFVKEKGRILEESSCSRASVPQPSLDDAVESNLFRECALAVEALEGVAGVFSWMNDQAGIDISAILRPFFVRFIGLEVPEMLRDAVLMRKFFTAKNVDFLFVRGNTDREVMGPLIAAKYMKSATCVCLEHASFATDDEACRIFDTETYDMTFARDAVTKEFLSRTANSNVFCSMHYMQQFEATVKRKRLRPKREKVVYVEKKFAGGARLFNNMIYPITWYYSFQKKLFDLFALQTRFDFVYKHANSISQNWAVDSIIRYIEDKKAAHITVSSEDFARSLRSADRVILDYPAGALFEAAVSGKPVLCLYADYLRIQPAAKKIFGKSLQVFRTEADALLLAQQFLDSDPEDFVVRFPMDRRDFLECFYDALSQMARAEAQTEDAVSRIKNFSRFSAMPLGGRK